jgi:hypothetical protein
LIYNQEEQIDEWKRKYRCTSTSNLDCPTLNIEKAGRMSEESGIREKKKKKKKRRRSKFILTAEVMKDTSEGFTAVICVQKSCLIA